MLHLAEFFLGLLAVLEAEGRELRENIIILTRRLIFLVFGLALAATAIIFFLIAIYKGLSALLSPLAALLLMGIICLIPAFFLIWISSGKNVRKDKKNNPESDTSERMQ